MCMPLRTLIVAERPYHTFIHPEISSAMSYDTLKSRTHLLILGLAKDLATNTKITFAQAME